jgi:ribosomal-protein-serine acetyltransferase
MFSHRVNDETVLKILETRYAEELFSLIDKNRAYLREWLPWVDGTKSSEHTKLFIESTLKQFSTDNGLHCGIFYKNEIAGCIGLHYVDRANKRTSIGYWLGAEFQGNGIMTSACRDLVHYAFKDLKLNRVEIRAGEHNLKSRAIPMRLGFVQEGIVRQPELLYDHFIDTVIYGALASEWDLDKMNKSEGELL